MNPEKYCKSIVKQSGSNFYYSFLFLPKRKRRAIYAVYAFSRIIDDIVDEGPSVSANEKMLTFWRGEIDNAYEGYSEHPLTKELVYAIREFDIPKEYFLEHLSGVTQDMVQKRYATYEDLKKYCYRVAAVVGLICLKIFEVEDTEKNKQAAVHLGLAFQMTNILRDVADDADRDRIYLPEEDLMKFGVPAEAILLKEYSEGFAKLMAFEWDRAKGFFDAANAEFDKSAAKKLLPAMIMADIYFDILMQIKGFNYDVFLNRASVPKKQKIKMAVNRWLRK